MQTNPEIDCEFDPINSFELSPTEDGFEKAFSAATLLSLLEMHCKFGTIQTFELNPTEKGLEKPFFVADLLSLLEKLKIETKHVRFSPEEMKIGCDGRSKNCTEKLARFSAEEIKINPKINYDDKNQVGKNYQIALNMMEGKNCCVKNLEKSRTTFEKLFKIHNHHPSAFFLGFMYHLNLGGKSDSKYAGVLFEEHAHIAKKYFQTNDDALGFSKLAIGFLHLSGLTVPQNDSIALKYFEESSKKGNSFAEYFAGETYYDGVSIPKNYPKAFEWYKKSSEQGCVNAQGVLGLMLRNGIGVPQDESEAMKWYKLAAEQGDSNAQYNVGLLYKKGLGTTPDFIEAAKWYKLSADQGHPRAQYLLAGLLYRGEGGVPRDTQLALDYMRRAAVQGETGAWEAHELMRMGRNVHFF